MLVYHMYISLPGITEVDESLKKAKYLITATKKLLNNDIVILCIIFELVHTAEFTTINISK